VLPVVVGPCSVLGHRSCDAPAGVVRAACAARGGRVVVALWLRGSGVAAAWCAVTASCPAAGFAAFAAPSTAPALPGGRTMPGGSIRIEVARGRPDLRRGADGRWNGACELRGSYVTVRRPLRSVERPSTAAGVTCAAVRRLSAAVRRLSGAVRCWSGALAWPALPLGCVSAGCKRGLGGRAPNLGRRSGGLVRVGARG